MIIDCIADLHGYRPQLEGGDLLIIAGDLTARDTPEQHCSFCKWVDSQDYKKIIVIAGNHDNLLEVDECLCLGDYDGIKTEYLQDSGTEFDGLKIWGSPWTHTFEGMNPHCKAFTCDTDNELAEKWSKIPHDVDILVTHSPPYTILDKTTDGKQVGGMYLMGGLIYCFRPKLWVFGHIHEAYGQTVFKDSTICVNASHVNERYKPVNKPIRIVL